MKSVVIICLIAAALATIPPIANQPFPEICVDLGYPVEAHYITTQDGYINTYFRIQAKNTQMKSGLPAVYLQHGLLDCGDDWIINNETIAPGLMIANAGFDVWIGNTRGNTYSLGHKSSNSSNKTGAYWDFSWQEMSQYDLPAAFDYIHNKTGQQINYIGHSQGSVIMFAALARRDPVILKYLKNFLAVGPVAYVNHATSPVVKLATKTKIGDIVLRDGKKFLFVTKEQRKHMETLCEVQDPVCIAFIRQIADANTTVDNTDRLPVFVGHPPAGTSNQNMDYWNQMSDNNKFQMYDYGKTGNLKHYGQTTAPLIDLSKINVPVHLFAGTYDELADPTDVARLYSELKGSPNVTLKYYNYGHLTFMWGLYPEYVADALKIIS